MLAMMAVDADGWLFVDDGIVVVLILASLYLVLVLSCMAPLV